jgi:uncharacterized protein (DUF1684 family)
MTSLRRTLTVVLAGVALTTCNAGAPPPPETEGDYVAELQVYRAARDEAFRKQPDEPVPPDKMTEFLPLKYFPPDPGYVVPASLKPVEKRTVVDMPTSMGKVRKQHRVGTLEFTLKGQPLTLGAYVEAGADINRLFVPFSDMTTGTETYYAGRYMELDRTPTGLYTVDFNKAFNPFCYYNTNFDCPIPPRESRLPLPIRAGERLP